MISRKCNSPFSFYFFLPLPSHPLSRSIFYYISFQPFSWSHLEHFSLHISRDPQHNLKLTVLKLKQTNKHLMVFNSVIVVFLSHMYFWLVMLVHVLMFFAIFFTIMYWVVYPKVVTRTRVRPGDALIIPYWINRLPILTLCTNKMHAKALSSNTKDRSHLCWVKEILPDTVK